MRRPVPGGAQRLSPKRKWQAITIATLLLVPSYWAVLAGLVGNALDDVEGSPDPGAALGLGLALLPFVFILLAFMTEHPRAPGAVVRAMGLSLLVGMFASAIAADAVSGVVAGVGAGGIVAIRAEPEHSWRARAIGVLIATVYTFCLVRTAGALALLSAPIFPLTAIGLADHYVEWRNERAAHQSASSVSSTSSAAAKPPR